MSKDFELRLRDPIAEARRQWEAHGWGEAAPGMAVVTTIARVHQLLVGRIEAVLSPYGLTFARFEILRLLGFTRRGGLPMGKIGERLQVHPASVTSAAKRLERDGMIRRSVDPDDNRVIIAAITDHGSATLEQATESVNRVFGDLGMGADDLDRLVDLLSPIRAGAGDPVQ